ncbi:MAG: FtsB family cell division protein [Gaiellaceae bacterium]|jgi:cell division protein FtsB|nr:septum formation initiator family protein [Acidobacteriota bacterium]
MPRKRSRRPPLATLARRWSAVLVIGTVAYFYYHPLNAYFSTRSELGATRAEVSQLAAQKRDLRRRLAASSSLEALAREARELGYVRPDERLYIVKGIAAWRRAHSSLPGGGG